jgi:hypothetical protein
LVYTADLKSAGLRPCGFESRPSYKIADVAQLAEQLICNQQVGSSSLPVSSIAGVAQLVERQPSKLNVVGSRPTTRLFWSFYV